MRSLRSAGPILLLASASLALAAEAPLERLTRSHFPKFFLSFSPDGSHLTYSRHHDNRRAANKILMGLRIVNADGSGDRPLLKEFESAVQIQEHGAWSPDGKRLLITGGGNDTGNAAKDIFVCDVATDFTASNLRKVIPGAGVNVGEQASWSPDGTEFCVTTTNHTLWIFSADGKSKRSLVQSAGNYCFQPAWSPDGEWIAFASDRDGNPEIYKMRSTGTELTRLTEAPGIDCRPVWSPDAEWLAFTSNREGNDDLFAMRADGSGLRQLTESPAVDDHAAWSPDGRRLAFVSLRDGGFDIYQLPVPQELQVARVVKRKKPVEAAPPSDLVARYTFEGDRGEIARDRAGPFPLGLHGATLVTEDKQGFLDFNGTEAYASAGNPTALQIAGPLTISVWVRPTAFENNGYVLSKHGWNLYIGSDLLPRFETRDAADRNWDTLAATAKLEPKKWSHVAAVFDTAKKRLAIYVNGQFSAERERADGAIGAVAGHPLEFGRYNAGRSQYLKGALDDVQIHQKALSDAEILRLSRNRE